MFTHSAVTEKQHGLQVRLYSSEKRNLSISIYKQFQTSHEEILDDAKEICDKLNYKPVITPPANLTEKSAGIKAWEIGAFIVGAALGFVLCYSVMK